MRFVTNINPNNERAFVVTRRAPKEWRYVFQNISRIHPRHFTTNDVRLQLEKLNIKIAPNSLQVKLARYVKKGILDKPKRDQFRVSSKGIKFFDILNNSNEEARMDTT